MAQEAFQSPLRKVDGQNRVAIPPEVRVVLGVQSGSYVRFVMEAGQVRLIKVNVDG